jgi:phospholipase/carboxylesterase
MKHGGVAMMARELDGPRLEPGGGAPTALVVLLHGYGANGDDLIPLGEGWRRWLPGAAFVAPNALQTIPGMHGALQWFALTLRDPGEYWRGVAGARPALDRFLDAELARYRLSADRLVLVGFSQGTMMALHVGLRRAAEPAAIIGFSGLLAGPEHLREITVRPPILLIHGEADDLIPIEALYIAREQLAEAGLTVEWHVRPGVGHGIDPGGQAMAGHFIAEALRTRVQKAP